MSAEIRPIDTDLTAEAVSTDEAMPEGDFLEDVAERIELFEHGSGESAIEYENRTGRALAAPDDTDMLKVEAYLDNLHDSGERDDDGNAVEYTTPDGRTRLSAHEYDLLKKVSESHFDSLENGGPGYVVGSYRAMEKSASPDVPKPDTKNVSKTAEQEKNEEPKPDNKVPGHGRADRRKGKRNPEANADESAPNINKQSKNTTRDSDKSAEQATDSESAPVKESERARTSAERHRARRDARRARLHEEAGGTVTSGEDGSEPAEKTATADDEANADGAPTVTAKVVPEATSESVPDQADEPVINILFPATDGSGEFVDGFRFQPRAQATSETTPSQDDEATTEVDDQTDDSESPTVVDGEVVGADDADGSAESQPLSRAERMRIAVKKIGAAILAADSLKVNEGDKRKEINLDVLGRRIKESLKRASDRAAVGALVVKATAQNTLESASDKLRAKDEDGERGKYSPLKIAVAGAGVLATAGVAYMAYRGISAGGVGNAAYNSANKGGYNPYTGGSIGRGGISAESAVPQGSGRLVNQPNVGDIVPEAAPSAPKFNDEQLSNYATLHAGQRVDTAGEALQDMFRKNGVAANREQFNTLLQDALKYDADVHQFTEGKTYDPTSMPDGYRFYLMDMDDIMRRLDELK